jgi:hypothetical protein
MHGSIVQPCDGDVIAMRTDEMRQKSMQNRPNDPPLSDTYPTLGRFCVG